MNKRTLKSINIKNLSDSASLEEVENTPNFKELIFDELCVAVNDGLDNNKNVITLFELNHSGCILELKEDYWVQSLKAAIEFFEKKEKYEKCNECNNLINKINERTTGIRQIDTSRRQNIKRKNSVKKEKKNKLNSK